MDLVSSFRQIHLQPANLRIPLVPSVRPGVGAAADRDCPEGDDSPSKELQDELVLRGYLAVLGVQMDYLAPVARYRRTSLSSG